MRILFLFIIKNLTLKNKKAERMASSSFNLPTFKTI